MNRASEQPTLETQTKLHTPTTPQINSLNSAFCLSVLVALCLVSYQHALNGNFVFDDTVAIVKNSDVTTTPTNYTAIFQHDFWGAPLQSEDSHKSYRPLTTLMFHFEYTFFGLRAKHMKTINLALHVLNTLLVWCLLKRLGSTQFHGHQVATLAAALFAVHPVHTEAVCGIVGRAELMFCFIFLLALLLSSTATESNLLIDVLVLLLTAFGMLFKETAVVIPLACVFLNYMHRGIYLRELPEQLRLLLNLRNIIYALATGVLIFLRLWLQNFENPRFKPMDNPVAFSSNPLTRLLSQHFLYVVNLWILLCPQWLSFDWALNCLTLIESVWDLRLQAVLALYSLLIVIIINMKYNYNLILALGLLVIPFLPASGIIRVGFVIAERVLYVPSIGFCLLVAHSFVHMQSTLVQSKILHALLKWLLLLVFACFLLRTRERANEWLTEEKLFTSALKVCPKNAKVHYNIARLASDKFEREKAFQHYHKAIELYPNYESALMNLGNLYRETGDLHKAEKYLKAALQALPAFPAAWMNLGIVQTARKNYALALRSYENALKYRKNYATCHYNIGNLYLEQKKYTQAMHYWQHAVALNPHQPKAWANILTMLDTRNLYDDALRLSAKALEHLPNETNILFIRANVLGKTKQYVEAEVIYKRVIEMEPLNALYWTNLGVLYHRWDKLNAAIESYRQALKLSPEKATTARENLHKLLQRKRQEEAAKNST